MERARKEGRKLARAQPSGELDGSLSASVVSMLCFVLAENVVGNMVRRGKGTFHRG